MANFRENVVMDMVVISIHFSIGKNTETLNGLKLQTSPDFSFVFFILTYKGMSIAIYVHIKKDNPLLLIQGFRGD